MSCKYVPLNTIDAELNPQFHTLNSKKSKIKP